MTDEMKAQITALRTAIMRRVEFDQCIHASSIEDEIGKWVREVFAEPRVAQKPFDPYRLVEKKRVRITYLPVATAIDGSEYISVTQENQRRAQALAQQKFNQQMASGYGGYGNYYSSGLGAGGLSQQIAHMGSDFGMAPLKQEGKPERDSSSRYISTHEINEGIKDNVLRDGGVDTYGSFWLGRCSGKKFRIAK